MSGGLSLQVNVESAGYGPLTVLREISISVPAGGIHAILGANGAGKTTLLRAISGILPFRGTLLIDGQEAANRRPVTLVKMGLSHVPERRGTFAEMTVHENLLVAAHTLSNRRRHVKGQVARILEWMPALAPLLAQPASSLSGGEQQMLALGRGLMSDPKILLLDEPSLGLAPVMTERIFDVLKTLNKATRLTVLLVEQNASVAIGASSFTYVLQTGRLAHSGPSEELINHPVLREAYLG
ncbi:branched-chain amino acid transport system ATP-binding protein [Aquamicrobium terrae]